VGGSYAPPNRPPAPHSDRIRQQEMADHAVCTQKQGESQRPMGTVFFNEKYTAGGSRVFFTPMFPQQILTVGVGRGMVSR